MNITAMTGPSTLSFDFTKMTNAGLLKAAKELGREGKIDGRDEAQLVGIASGVDYAYPNGDGPTVEQTLKDPTQKNFAAYLQQEYDSASSQSGSKGADLYASLLNMVSKYQSHSPELVGSSISTLA